LSFTNRLTEIKRIIDSSRQHSTYISPVVDNTARLLVAVIGGLLVLVPMAALSYITSLHWILIAAFLFTFNFSVAVTIVSKASNDQVIAATAAYGAILVIFVANRIH
jgi:VIT1/CCC1 family predicted Fe2+/Mn2+ transporter